MHIDSYVIWRGRVYVLDGIDPINVSGRRAYLREAGSDEVIEVPFGEVEEAPGEHGLGSAP